MYSFARSLFNKHSIFYDYAPFPSPCHVDALSPDLSPSLYLFPSLFPTHDRIPSLGPEQHSGRGTIDHYSRLSFGTPRNSYSADC